MPKEVHEMFTKISRNYDIMNHIFSFNIDKGWRTEAAREAIIPKKSYSVLDIASGTGDLAIAVEREASSRGRRIILHASDFNESMLEIAKEKFRNEGMKNVRIEVESAFDLSHKPNSIDVITSGFGLRSFFFSKAGGERNLRKFIAESYRVLRPGGKIVLLDMAMPDKKSERAFFKAYSNFMLFLGSFVDKETYGWLVNTIKNFDKKGLLSIMKEEGFKKVQIRNLKSGIAFIATGEK